MAHYAVVKNGVVESMVEWDGVAEFSVPGSELIEATADDQHADAHIGDSWDGSVFTFVAPTEVVATSEEALESTNKRSGHDKLVALGLTDAEIAALGMVPMASE